MDHECEAYLAEMTAIKRLCDAGYEAFVSPSSSTFKGGVCVRMSFQDQRIEWTSRRKGGVPAGFMFSESGAEFVLHAGRADAPQGIQVLADFVARLDPQPSDGPQQWHARTDGGIPRQEGPSPSASSVRP